jgi:hypothetical protein
MHWRVWDVDRGTNVQRSVFRKKKGWGSGLWDRFNAQSAADGFLGNAGSGVTLDRLENASAAEPLDAKVHVVPTAEGTPGESEVQVKVLLNSAGKILENAICANDESAGGLANANVARMRLEVEQLTHVRCSLCGRSRFF